MKTSGRMEALMNNEWRDLIAAVHRKGLFPVNIVPKSFLNRLIKRLWSAGPLRGPPSKLKDRNGNQLCTNSQVHISTSLFALIEAITKERFSTSLGGISIWNQKLPLFTLNISLFPVSAAPLEPESSCVYDPNQIK